MLSFIPSIRNIVSKRMRVQEMTSSAGNLCGSKFQLSNESMRRDRVSFGKSDGGLWANQRKDRTNNTRNIHLYMVLVHCHQGVNIHVA
jgi:hypothetical protein